MTYEKHIPRQPWSADIHDHALPELATGQEPGPHQGALSLVLAMSQTHLEEHREEARRAGYRPGLWSFVDHLQMVVEVVRVYTSKNPGRATVIAIAKRGSDWLIGYKLYLRRGQITGVSTTTLQSIQLEEAYDRSLTRQTQQT